MWNPTELWFAKADPFSLNLGTSLSLGNRYILRSSPHNNERESRDGDFAAVDSS